jgi:predicted transcriptional regulator
MSKVPALAQRLKRSPKMLEALKILDEFGNSMDSDTMARKLGIPQSNARRILVELNKSGAVLETTGQRRGQMFKISPDGSDALSLAKRLLADS